MYDLQDQETTMGKRAQRNGTIVFPGRLDHTLGGVGTSQQSSTCPTEDGDVDDVARGVIVLFPSGSSPRPCSGLRPLFTIREKSASEDEEERESMGSRAPGTETTILSDTPSHGPGRVTTDPTLQGMGSASPQLGSDDDVRYVGAGASASGTGDARDVFLRSPSIDGSQGCPEMVMGQGATSDLTELADDDEAECIVCLHRAQDEASVNENMPRPVRYILETAKRPIQEMGEHVKYPDGMHWLGCCHKPFHVTCMIRSFYRLE